MKTWQFPFVILLICFTFAIPAAPMVAQEKETMEELFQEAVGFLRDEKTDQALEVLRKARKLYPDEMRTSFALVQILQQAGMEAAKDDRKAASKYFYEAAEIADSMLGDSKVPPQAASMLASAIYNKACSLAVDGKKAEAIKALKKAFDSGFDDVATVRNDEDFKAIADSREFKAALANGEAIVKKRKAEALARKIELIKKDIAKFESFDFDFELTSSKGKAVKLADYKGKFLIVDFWGTWCGPCVAEIPHFIKLKNQYASKGLEIVGIAYERTDDEAEASQNINTFLERRKVNYESLIGDEETSDQVDIEGFPTTLFLDKAGKVRFKVVGYHEYEVLEAISKEIMKN